MYLSSRICWEYRWEYDCIFNIWSSKSLPLTSTDPYIVAITGSGLVVGSASLAQNDLIGGQQSIAVWGDDTQTPEVDGALAGENYIFNLLMEIHCMT